MGPLLWLARAFDRADEARARSRREAFGRRRWLLSWERRGEGGWTARLSGPEVVRTIERSAPTRSWAIARSARAMNRLLALRARAGLRAPVGPTP